MDLDSYLTQTISFITEQKEDIDVFTLTSDLKQYILDESEQLSERQNININNAVKEVLINLGSPEAFAKKILKEIQQEKRYLLGKIALASLLAFFPVIVLIIVILH